MEHMNEKTLYFYKAKFKGKEAQYNVPSTLPEYFAPMIGDKKKVVIAELGAGPVNTIGNTWPETEVEIHASDILWSEYEKYWEGKKPIVPIEYQDFENLTYPDEMFDIVHCVNALDHTEDALEAILELQRVCKKGGYVYLRHSPDQKKRYGGMHRWNATTYGFHNGARLIELHDFEIHLEGDLIVAIWKKI